MSNLNNNFLTNDILFSELMNLVGGVAEQVPEHGVCVLAKGRGSASNLVLCLAKLHCGSNLANLLLKLVVFRLIWAKVKEASNLGEQFYTHIVVFNGFRQWPYF